LPPIAESAARMGLLLCQAGHLRWRADLDALGVVGAAGDQVEDVEDAPGELAFERSESLLVGLAVGLVSGDVGLGGCVGAFLDDGDRVQGAVELAVAGSVESVALLAAGGDVERGDAGVHGELGVGAEALDAGDLADQLRGGQRAAAWEREQLRRLAPHERLDLALEPVCLACQLAAVTDEFAGDAHLHRLLAAGQAPTEPLEHLQGAERAPRRLELGVDLVQVPAQPVLDPGPLADQVLAVVDEQPQLPASALELRGGQVGLPP
jgi:hypothetical protein